MHTLLQITYSHSLMLRSSVHYSTPLFMSVHEGHHQYYCPVSTPKILVKGMTKYLPEYPVQRLIKERITEVYVVLFLYFPDKRE